jgi:hypothetical protein
MVDQIARERGIRRAEDPRVDGLTRIETLTSGRHEIYDPPGFPSLSAAPELQAAAVATLGAYRAWSAGAARQPGAEHERFAWALVRDAAQDAAALLNRPASEMDAVAHVIAVDGRWSYVAGAGCGICSAGVATDPAAASGFLRQLFASGAGA